MQTKTLTKKEAKKLISADITKLSKCSPILCYGLKMSVVNLTIRIVRITIFPDTVRCEINRDVIAKIKAKIKSVVETFVEQKCVDCHCKGASIKVVVLRSGTINVFLKGSTIVDSISKADCVLTVRYSYKLIIQGLLGVCVPLVVKSETEIIK